MTFGVDGSIRFIYSDEVAQLAREEFGSLQVSRASHVEPCGDGWTADMSPVGGPVLGPYTHRSEALSHEVEWLKANLGL
jgi:hypothetical protein